MIPGRPLLPFVPAPTIAVEIGTPNHTLYLQNLNERARLKDLRYMLTTMFSKYGKLLDVIVKKRMRLRGQAWVVFEKKEFAMKALHGLQGKFLYEKPIVIRYAKSKSDLIAKMDGTFEDEVAKRLAEREGASGMPRLTRKEQMIQSLLSNPLGMAILPASNEFIVPNSILFVENIPQTLVPESLDTKILEKKLEDLFNQYPGFQEVRLVPGKTDIAFVEFENEYQSNMAMLALNNYKLDGSNEIKLTFAKK